MIDLGPWSNDDFDNLSWHDVHVHALRFGAFNETEGTCDLLLDLDYILRWEKAQDGFLFTVCQAILRFHRVFNFKMALDYASPTAGMCPFSIDGIVREPVQAPTGYKYYRWRITINWPQGTLEFEAPNFAQTLVGSPSIQNGQSLSGDKRVIC
jgi:hypothetical protein